MRGSSPSRGSGNLGSKKSGNTPQKVAYFLNYKIIYLLLLNRKQ